MAGNEAVVVKFLIQNKNHLTLNHLGKIIRIQNPSANGNLIEISDTSQLRTEDANKKADIFLNGVGVSIKQSGSSFLYNRLQRAEMLTIFQSLGFKNSGSTLTKIDSLVNKFHNGLFTTRDRHWSEGFNETDFKSLLCYLMMQGSANHGVSLHPATLVLTAPATSITAEKITCLTFAEYFEKYKGVIFISLRRQWVGQSSKSEHTRANGLAKKIGNAPWIFQDIVGTPRDGWKSPADFPISKRRTVYMIFITVKP